VCGGFSKGWKIKGTTGEALYNRPVEKQTFRVFPVAIKQVTITMQSEMWHVLPMDDFFDKSKSRMRLRLF